MSNLVKFRIGNDAVIKPVLTVSEGGSPVAWTDAVKKVIALSDVQRIGVELPFVVVGGVLKATFKAEAQKYLGKYHIIVVMNDGSTATWDAPAFEIVATTAEADTNTGLVAIEVSGTLQVSTGGGGGVWGAITGTLANQTDLANALAGKANTTDIPTADITANTAARHTHTNKTTLDGITPQRVVNWDGKYTKPQGGIPSTDLENTLRGAITRAENLVDRVQFVNPNTEVEMYLQEWENLRGSLAIVMMDGNAIEAICLLNIYEYDSQLMFTYGTDWMITEMTLEKLISDYSIGITWREFFDALIEEGCSSIATAEMISNCVFKNIDETLAGAKTFLKPIKIAAEEDSNEFYTLASNFDDEGVNILNLNGSNGEVRIQGVADPVTDTDAVNKGYLATALSSKANSSDLGNLTDLATTDKTSAVAAINEVQAGKQNSADRITDTWASSTSKYPSTAAADARFVPKSLPLITSAIADGENALIVDLQGNYRYLKIILPNYSVVSGSSAYIIPCYGGGATSNSLRDVYNRGLMWGLYVNGSTALMGEISIELGNGYADLLSRASVYAYSGNAQIRQSANKMDGQTFVSHIYFYNFVFTAGTEVLIYGY